MLGRNRWYYSVAHIRHVEHGGLCMSKWQGATVGRESKTMGLRITDEEEQRLELLRQEFRLTSKGQVIRAALDLLERVVVATDSDEGERAITRRGARRIRRKVGVPRVGDVQAAPLDDAEAVRGPLETSYKYVLNPPDSAADPEQSPSGLSGGDAPDGGQLGEVQEA